jgi:RHS repeat-associated protein
VRTEDSGGTTRASCAYTSYDGAAYATGQHSTLTKGLTTTSDRYTSCGTSPSFTPSGKIETTRTYDAFGNQLTTNDPDANAGNSAHKGCTVGSSTYSACLAFDAIFSSLPISSANALNQTTTTGYSASTDATGGFGLWPTSATDPNSQVTKTAYDALGRTVSATLPSEGTGLTTTNTSYTVWCSGSAAQSPCVEVDTTQRLNSTSTVTLRKFYDGLGRLVETRAPAAGGHDTVQYAYYDPSGREVFQSVPYLVTAYTGAPGVTAYSIPDSTQVGTSLLPYTSLLSMTSSDPLSHNSTSTVSVACNASGTGDTTCYAQATSIDALNHKTTSLTDALGRTIYTQNYTGNSSGSYAVYSTIKNTYDLNGNLTKIIHPDGTSATTFTYDAAGRKTGMTDPDLGTETYAYDADGNLTQSTDARGAGGGGGGPTTLMGDTTVEPTQDAVIAGQAVAFHFVAASSGTATTAYVYVDSGNLSPTIQVGLYADNGSNLPGTLLAQATISSPTNGAWNSVTLPGSPAVTAGQTYWIGVLGPASGNDLYFRDTSVTGTNDMVVYSSSTTLNSLPSTWANGGSSPGLRASAYIVQSGSAPSSGGIVYAGYDGLDRQLWRNTTNSPTGAYASYSYDQTTGHGSGIGRLTTESFTGGTTAQPLHGSYSYTYDTRGRTTNLTLTTTENATYPLTYAYNDAGQPTSMTFSDGEVFTQNYDSASGWLSSAVTTPSGGSQVNLLTSVTYSGVGGAAGHITSANLANGAYSYSASYDNDLRLTSMSLLNVSLGTTLFSSSRGYDAVGNVTSVNTMLANGTDNQRFCYDDLNRLVWAGTMGTPSCGGTVTAGTLTSAQYTATFSYDTLNRITGGTLGTLTFGDSAHLHAATSSSLGETASYDAAGDMTCRAPTSATTCTGSSPTGALLTYDAERRLASWQNAPTSPTSQAWFLYDGEGHRVEQFVSGGSGNHTYYLPGNVEEVTPSNTLVKYYSGGGLSLGENTATSASGIAYLASDGLGSVTEALNQTGSATGSVLYGPYGDVRYTSGAMPTAKGFTGQYSDATTGLDYYGARYYDPALSQFTSADTVSGLNRYGYVAGNPETFTDPTGHRIWTGINEGSYGNFCPPRTVVNSSVVNLGGVSELTTAGDMLKSGRELRIKMSVTQKRLALVDAQLAYWDAKAAYRAVNGPGSIPHSWRRPGASDIRTADGDLKTTLGNAEDELYALDHGVGTALIGVGAGMDGALAGRKQWIDDDGKYGFGQHLLRAGVADIVHGGLSAIVVGGTGLIGAGVGAVAGGAVGIVGGAVIGGLGGMEGGPAGMLAGAGAGGSVGLDMGIDIGGLLGATTVSTWASNQFSGWIDDVTNSAVSLFG